MLRSIAPSMAFLFGLPSLGIVRCLVVMWMVLLMAACNYDRAVLIGEKQSSRFLAESADNEGPNGSLPATPIGVPGQDPPNTLPDGGLTPDQDPPNTLPDGVLTPEQDPPKGSPNPTLTRDQLLLAGNDIFQSCVGNCPDSAGLFTVSVANPTFMLVERGLITMTGPEDLEAIHVYPSARPAGPRTLAYAEFAENRQQLQLQLETLTAGESFRLELIVVVALRDGQLVRLRHNSEPSVGTGERMVQIASEDLEVDELANSVGLAVTTSRRFAQLRNETPSATDIRTFALEPIAGPDNLPANGHLMFNLPDFASTSMGLVKVLRIEHFDMHIRNTRKLVGDCTYLGNVVEDCSESTMYNYSENGRFDWVSAQLLAAGAYFVDISYVFQTIGDVNRQIDEVNLTRLTVNQLQEVSTIPFRVHLVFMDSGSATQAGTDILDGNVTGGMSFAGHFDGTSLVVRSGAEQWADRTGFAEADINQIPPLNSAAVSSDAAVYGAVDANGVIVTAPGSGDTEVLNAFLPTDAHVD